MNRFSKLFKTNTKKGIRMVSIVMTMVIVSFTAFGFINVNTTVDARSISELEKKISDLEKSNKNLSNNLNNISGQIKDEEEKQEIYEKNIENTEKQIDLFKQKIELMQHDIGLKKGEISVKEKEISESQDLFAQRVRAMYIAGSNSALTTILEAKSFSDFLTRAELLKRISKSDQDLIDKLSKQRNDLEKIKAKMEEQNQSLNASKTQLDKKSENLESMKKQSEASKAQLKAKWDQYYAEKKKNQKLIDQQYAEIDRIIAEQSGGGTAPEGAFKWPVPSSSRITSPFGWRTMFGNRDFHTGVDIGAPSGTTIVASQSGKVISVKYQNVGYGYNVIVDHGGGYVTLYAHCSRIDVKAGDTVSRGQAIAGVGTTGNSTGNHLHFEVRVNGKQVNPMGYVRKP
ncbi:peptidoglycan DD-metalloendopeptidase family protein [Paludicola sp. MB14-C6]|uniref:murein hydrolase activator EnvC family protein n=1 Tax=Paludihabitans sp. MB14-C6 TaxID=3070656 RepID=UPI0027DBB097|nr:peptidoglycan DD-metalloendopeptidase family protein [Paludicola sp. MB14-C6]WMJ23567.1 peptidoglycan DD-metalloendopeptidase family protein [Paludicola sp. MB14-C6]